MNSYVGDEGYIIEQCIQGELVSFVYLEEFQLDDYFNEKVNLFINFYPKILSYIDSDIYRHVEKVYDVNKNLIVKKQLIKVYFCSDEEEGDYGLIYNLNLDSEHGIGIKLTSWKVTNIGSSEIAFM